MLDWNDPISNFSGNKEKVKEVHTELETHDHVVDEQPSDSFSATDSLQPVNVNDKRIVNGTADINQLAPFKYPWAWNFFLNANKKPLDAVGH